MERKKQQQGGEPYNHQKSNQRPKDRRRRGGNKAGQGRYQQQWHPSDIAVDLVRDFAGDFHTLNRQDRGWVKVNIHRVIGPEKTKKIQQEESKYQSKPIEKRSRAAKNRRRNDKAALKKLFCVKNSQECFAVNGQIEILQKKLSGMFDSGLSETEEYGKAKKELRSNQKELTAQAKIFLGSEEQLAKCTAFVKKGLDGPEEEKTEEDGEDEEGDEEE